MARFRIATAFALALAAASSAADAPRAQNDAQRTPDVEAIVPVPPYEHERLHFFGRGDHHVVPGTVTIDRAPYECDLDRRRFDSREDFVAHLRTAHHAPTEQIPDALVVRGGVVHFVGK